MSHLARKISSQYINAAKYFVPRSQKGMRRIMAYVEGYDDVAFWRSVLSDFENDKLRFEISVPSRDDLAKGKKVLLSMADNCGDNMILCMDSDFDYLFQNHTPQSRIVNQNKHIFQTYTYAIENYECYPPSLRKSCVRVSKNDAYIFDFEEFMKEFSTIVYPLFLWYVLSAYEKQENFFPLNDFKNSVKIHFIVLENNGVQTLDWLRHQVERRLHALERENPLWIDKTKVIAEKLTDRGVTNENVYMYMHGHTLKDNVVMVLMSSVCETLKIMCIDTIRKGRSTSVHIKNELSGYQNSLRDINQVLSDNQDYKQTSQYKILKEDIEMFVRRLTGEINGSQ